MTKAMNWKTLVMGYKDLGYTTDVTTKYVCPDCYQVNMVRAQRGIGDRELRMNFITRASRKVLAFHKEGTDPVAACPCGFRKTKGVVHHGKQWCDEFNMPVTDTKEGLCKAHTKAGVACGNKAKLDSDCCGVHHDYVIPERKDTIQKRLF